MVTSPPTSILREQLLLSWAVNEIHSPRWYGVMSASASPGLLEKIARGETHDFTALEQQELLHGLRGNRWYFIENYIDKAKTFALIDVPGEILELLPVLPGFGHQPYPVTLGHYMDGESQEDWELDPRNHAKRAVQNPVKRVYEGYPIIAYDEGLKSDILIDGYLRCMTAIWKRRAGEQIAPMRMIYCAR